MHSAFLSQNLFPRNLPPFLDLSVVALHLVALVGGFGVSVALLPVIIQQAVKRHWLDMPDARRVHKAPVPRLGGISIFLATVLVAGAILGIGATTGALSVGYPRLLPGIVIGATIVFLTGLFDDLRGISPSGKLVAQTLAAVITVGFGFEINSVALFEGSSAISLGVLAVPLTVLWIVGMTNAFNLIDGADGLAGRVALIALSTAVGVELILHGDRSLIITLTMLGAVIGFLRFNNTPARIFLGDSGSMTLGFFLSIRLVLASTSEGGATYALVPLFALAFPLLDTAIAIARRWLRGHPFSRADGRHIHHQLLALGLSTRHTVDLLGLVFALVAVLGASVVFAPPRFTAAFMLAVATLMFALLVYGARWLRYTEFVELGASVASVFRNARSVVQEKLRANEAAERIRNASSLQEVHRVLDDLVAESRLLDVQLLAGSVRQNGPDRQQISPVDRLPVRLDYPFAWHAEDGTHELILRVWCERPSKGGHPGMERLAERVGPALEHWFKTHPSAELPEQSSAPGPQIRRSGGRRRPVDL